MRSLPDGLAHVLAEYIENRAERHLGDAEPIQSNHFFEPLESHSVVSNSSEWELKLDPELRKIGDICPECGQAAVINQEGCRKCYACGYSEC